MINAETNLIKEILISICCIVYGIHLINIVDIIFDPYLLVICLIFLFGSVCIGWYGLSDVTKRNFLSDTVVIFIFLVFGLILFFDTSILRIIFSSSQTLGGWLFLFFGVALMGSVLNEIKRRKKTGSTRKMERTNS